MTQRPDTTDRLSPLHLLPPPMMASWRATDSRMPATQLRRDQGPSVPVPLPLFWYAPDWYLYPAERADSIAAAVARQGVLVSALRSEIAAESSAPLLHADRLPRMLPYRPERFGLLPSDFDHATVIDIRLTLARDASGRFAYPAEQVARWESHSGKANGVATGWVTATAFPPDVPDAEGLPNKVQQLRMLSPDAAVFVSTEPTHLEYELPKLLAAKPDGIILRLDRLPMSGLALAKLVLATRQRIVSLADGDVPLWVAPGQVSADDAAKLVALGASGVSVDSWCNDLFATRLQQPLSAAQRLGLVDTQLKTDQEYIDELVRDHLRDSIDRFVGLVSSLLECDLADRLGSFENSWAEQLGVRRLG